jgi:hypothetical protein
VLISQVVYEKQLAELELLRLLAEAEDDVSQNQIFEAENVFNDLKNQLKKD